MIQDGSLKFKLMAYPGTAHASVAVLLRLSEEGFDPSVVKCPWCGHIGMRKLHQKYYRFIVDWVDGAPKIYSVEISCYVCTNPACRRKQAYLPDAIVPYAQYSFLFIMQVLQVYYERAMTVDEICETFEITRRRVYRWVDRFRDDLVALLSFHVVADHRQVQCICFHMLLQRMTFSEFCERYLQMTRRTPLQMHPVRSIVHTRTAHAECRRAAAALLYADAAGASSMTPDTVRFKHIRLARPPTLSQLLVLQVNIVSDSTTHFRAMELLPCSHLRFSCLSMPVMPLKSVSFTGKELSAVVSSPAGRFPGSFSLT